MDILLPLVYAGNVAYFKQLKQGNKVWFELHEHYIKQTYRNRCTIYGANGRLDLIIPIQKGKSGHQAIQDVKINYDQNWQRLHWKSLESAYRSSPYFEYYEHEIEPFYQNQYTHLHEFNVALQNKLLQLLEINVTPVFTESYVAAPGNCTDLRAIANPVLDQTENGFQTYTQVFETKHGFLSNLSVFDVLFNCGPQGQNMF